MGHAEHEEVVGTLGEAPDQIQLVQQAEDVADTSTWRRGVRWRTSPRRRCRSTRTADVVDALRRRFPRCGRPDHERHLLRHAEPPGRRAGHRRTVRSACWSSVRPTLRTLPGWSKWRGARGVGPSSLRTPRKSDLDWLDTCDPSIGVDRRSLGPRVARHRGRRLMLLTTLGPATVTEHRTTEETVQFSLPRQVR